MIQVIVCVTSSFAEYARSGQRLSDVKRLKRLKRLYLVLLDRFVVEDSRDNWLGLSIE